MIMTDNQVFRRIQSNPRFPYRNGNSSSTFVIFPNLQQQQQPTLNVLLRPSRSNNNTRFHVRRASAIIPQQPPSYENLRRKRYLMESRNALYLPPVTTVLCISFFFVYFFREWINVLGEDDVYVSWQKVITEKQVWRLFIAQFFHFSRASVLINTFTLYAIGRYLERKVTTVAMLSVVMIMSVVSHLLYIILNPYFCAGIQTEYIWGFGNVVYSLRVMLAYALEPRNYERDLVFGLYPMVLSANAAPWQPVLDLIIFKLVLPEQCITGQLSGILAGFIVTFFLLVWPTEGVYIASPPYFWVPDQDEEPDSQNRNNGRSSGSWKMETHPSPYLFMGPPSDTAITGSVHTTELYPRQAERIRTNDELIPNTNALKRNSDEMKRRMSDFLVSAKESVVRKFGGKSEEEEGKDVSNKNCKLLHKRRRKRSKKRIVMHVDTQQLPPLSPRMSEKSSGSVSSIDPDYLSGSFSFKSNLETVPIMVYN